MCWKFPKMKTLHISHSFAFVYLSLSLQLYYKRHSIFCTLYTFLIFNKTFKSTGFRLNIFLFNYNEFVNVSNIQVGFWKLWHTVRPHEVYFGTFRFMDNGTFVKPDAAYEAELWKQKALAIIMFSVKTQLN